MRTLFLVLLCGTAIIAALIWNRLIFAPSGPVESDTTEVQQQKAYPNLPKPQEYEVEFVLGYPPGSKPIAQKPKKAVKKTERRGKPTPETKPKPEKPEERAQRKAILREGETLYQLARRLLGDPRRYKEILKLNGLDEEEAKRLRPGTPIKIPYK